MFDAMIVLSNIHLWLILQDENFSIKRLIGYVYVILEDFGNGRSNISYVLKLSPKALIELKQSDPERWSEP